MRRFLAVFILGLSACSGNTPPSGTEDVIPTKFSRTFSSVQCWIGPNATPAAPCFIYISPSHTVTVDSGRIVFASDNSVTWMFSQHTRVCPCYLGGCSTPCYDDPSVIQNQSGTYAISADTIDVTFSQGTPAGLKLRTVIPQRVPMSWDGPDSLLCIGCTSVNAVIFKSG